MNLNVNAGCVVRVAALRSVVVLFAAGLDPALVGLEKHRLLSILSLTAPGGKPRSHQASEATQMPLTAKIRAINSSLRLVF